MQNPTLSERLKALGVQIGARDLPAPQPQVSHGIEQEVGGIWISTPYGETYEIEETYPSDHQHGLYSLQVGTPPDIVAEYAREPALVDIAPEAYTFLDIETTGLSGSTGTYAFLIGAGRFYEGAFHIKQFFLPAPQSESAQLAAFADFIYGSQALITFNGKAFDVPVLQTRFTLQGLATPFKPAPSHLDLLHLARRLWRERLPSRTLLDLEGQILGILRSQADIPSWIIPQLYFDYLTTGDARLLKGVFYHNAKDILGLVTLFNHVNTLLNNPLNRPETPAIDLAGIGRLYETLGRAEDARQLYEQCLQLGLPEDLHQQTEKRLSVLYKRAENWEAASRIWESAALTGHIYAHVELAKYFEHQRKDIPAALHWTQAALDHFTHSLFQDADLRSNLENRRNRLLLKLSRHAE
jgi:uncharacterized protein YprB with RNaseH-like and TPR domain